MPLTLGEVYRAVDAIAPFSLAEDWDNVGILAGREDLVVTGIVCALDLNRMVIDETLEKGANLIITHHPILFRGRKNLREDDAEGRLLCELIRAQIGLIAAHTSFDNAQPGVNDALASQLELINVQTFDAGLRVGETNCDTLENLRAKCADTLRAPVRCYGEANKKIKRVAVLGGAGGDYWPQALAAGADVFITGEIAHHKAWDAYQNGMAVLEAGHAATELPAVKMLAEGLQSWANGVKWNVRIFESAVELFR